MTDRACSRCEFWKAEGAATSMGGECRHDPPRVYYLDESKSVGVREERSASGYAMKSVWPVTAPDDWCGQFRERPLPKTGQLVDRGKTT